MTNKPLMFRLTVEADETKLGPVLAAIYRQGLVPISMTPFEQFEVDHKEPLPEVPHTRPEAVKTRHPARRGERPLPGYKKAIVSLTHDAVVGRKEDFWRVIGENEGRILTFKELGAKLKLPYSANTLHAHINSAIKENRLRRLATGKYKIERSA